MIINYPFPPHGQVIGSGAKKYRQCVTTLMDTTDPTVKFNESGESNWVEWFQSTIEPRWKEMQITGQFERMVETVKKNCGRGQYDCILGLSGGVDSSYLAYLAWKAGLRVLAMHTDAGWNSEIAVSNIERILQVTGFDLVTHVVDWPAMASVQKAFLEAGVPNMDIPQDHAIFAALYRTAAQHNIRFVLSGSNYASESILPRVWGHDALDLTHIKDVCASAFLQRPLDGFPTMGYMKYGVIYQGFRRMKIVRLLNTVPYARNDAIQTLEKEFKWRQYGEKHFESRWTRYFQGYFLPRRFGFDKRLCHYSSLILSGQITRSAALNAMAQQHYTPDMRQEDEDIILSKLNAAPSDIQRWLNQPRRPHEAFAHGGKMLRTLTSIRNHVLRRK